MEYQEFTEKLLEKISDRLGDNVSAEIVSMQKANGTRKETMCFTGVIRTGFM